jgi:hypothetical protein
MCEEGFEPCQIHNHLLFHISKLTAPFTLPLLTHVQTEVQPEIHDIQGYQEKIRSIEGERVKRDSNPR